MIRTLSQLSIILIALCVIGCKKSPADSKTALSAPDARPSPQATPTPPPSAQPKGILMSDIFTREKSLSYNGFKISKLESIAKRSESERIEFSYAVIKKNGRVMAKFDSFRGGLMNATDIGLFPFLGGNMTSSLQQTISPVDGSIYAERRLATSREIETALAKADTSRAAWKRVPVAERAAACKRMLDWLLERAGEIGEELTWQIGRPIAYSPNEIRRGFQERV